MSYLFSPDHGIKLTDTPIIDAFGRLRTSSPITIFDSQLQYDKQPLLWDEKIVGGASSTHQPNESAVTMTVGTASGDSVIRQTFEYFRYQPGKSQLIVPTGALGTATANVQKLIGYGDERNGIFFGQDGSGTFALLRSNITGTPSDARKVYQANWTIDTMDGTGPSRVTVDWTKSQIFLIDIEWLGVGRVRLGMVHDGIIYYVHEFLNSNRYDTTYMTTANLPVRYEITNTAASTGSSMEHICSQVASEGGYQDTAAYPFSQEEIEVSIPNGSGNIIGVMAFRQANTFNSVANEIKFDPLKLDVIHRTTTVAGAVLVCKVFYNAQVNATSWSTVDASSGIEYAGPTDITSFSGGIQTNVTLASSAKSTASPVVGRTLTSRLPFGRGIDKDQPITILIAAYATDGNSTGSFSFEWEEIR